MHRLVYLSILVFVPALASAECRYSADRNFDVPAAGIRTIAFDLGSSDVIVEGAPGISNIEVRGRACASQAQWLDQLTVDQNRNGDRLEITPHDGHDLHGFGSHYAYVQLRVRMPTKLAVTVKSVSGDAEVGNIASLDFDSSSGDVQASHISGTFGAHVSSGDVRGEDIGDVEIRATSSGDINLRDVHGPVNVARSGSGDLRLDTVGGVQVGSVGSGDVWVSDASGDVAVESIGSGDLSVNGVNGNFRVGSRGSGSIDHRNVHGTVSVPRDNDD